jgi:preprotein translocase subunit SecE
MHLKIYKKGQGKYTRLWSAFAAALITGLGCWRLYVLLEGIGVGTWVETMVPAGLFVIFATVIFWLANKPSAADFLIAAEGEMKKVSWSSRQEIVSSTTIVIVVVVFMAVLLGVTDLGFRMFFNWLIG